MYTDFYTKTDFKYQFERLGVITKEFSDRDQKKPVINIKMISLNRQTLPMYKRLIIKNKLIVGTINMT